MQVGHTLSSQWIAVLVPHMESTMARWDRDTSLQLGSSSAGPCKGLTVRPNVLSNTKTVPLFLSLNVAELFRSERFLWKCRRTYWLSKLNTNKTGIMSHYLCSGAIMLLFIALTVITVSPDLTVTHPSMIYPKKGFIWKTKIPQVLVIS